MVWSKVSNRLDNSYSINNVLLKAHAKLGGTNHYLASRSGQNSISASSNNSFQTIPNSIGWFFDQPCMLMGIDISHPEVGKKGGLSVGAVVASMDGGMTQYKCYTSVQAETNKDDVADLQEGAYLLIKACF